MIKIKKYLPLIIFILFFLFQLLFPRFVTIRSVVCKSQYGACSEIIDAKLIALSGKKLQSINKQSKALLGNDPSVKSYYRQLRLPSTLEINIVEVKPEFSITDKESKLYANIAENGKVLNISETTQLPTVSLPDKIPSVGQTISPENMFALNLISELFYNYKIKESRIDNDSLVIVLDNELRVIFPREGDKEVLLGTFFLIYNNLESENSELGEIKKISTIDLRFKNPVLN